MIPAHGALFKTISTALSGSGKPWTGVYLDRAPATATRPYVVYFLSGGGERNRLLAKADAELVLTVKAVGDDLAAVMTCAGMLATILNDAGIQDGAGKVALDGGQYWQILTTTQGLTVRLNELVDGKAVYHEGFQLRVVMEAV